MSNTYRYETRRYNGDEGEVRVYWHGPGWYAQRSVRNDIEAVLIAPTDTDRDIADRVAYVAGYGTPFRADMPHDCR